MSRSITGVSADGPWLQISREKVVTNKNDTGKVEIPRSELAQLPHAILLPRFQREPHRLEIGRVPHPRGCGLQWPNEAIVDEHTGSGRIPIGLLIDLLESSGHWNWRGSEQENFDPAFAFTDALSQSFSSHSRDSEIIFTIPNHWGESLQQKILDAFQRSGVRCKLLWRPVAAALEWTAHFENEILHLIKPGDEHIGKLISIYIGYNHFEISELELVSAKDSTGKAHILPARNRPAHGGTSPSSGFRNLIEYLEQQMRSSECHTAVNASHIGAVWNQLWCSDFLTKSQSNVLPDVYQPNTALESVVCPIPMQCDTQINQWLLRTKKALSSSYAGVVVTGAYCTATTQQHGTLWQRFLKKLGIASGLLLVEGVDTKAGLLARGAQRFGLRLQSGLPTYLDTLPKLQMVISEHGEPTWIDLLEPEDRWVDGGRLWERPEPITNLSIAAHSIDLKLAIAHEEFANVREVLTLLPRSSKQTENVSLTVQMFPAQGKARIEIHPQNKELFEGERVFVDWRGMQDFMDESGRPTDKQGYLDSLPRIFPDLLPKIQSQSRWRAVEQSMYGLMDLIRLNASKTKVNTTLSTTRAMLREKDGSKYPRDATAFDSDGRCSGNFDLNQFMKLAWPYFQTHQPDAFVRAAAYMHVDHREFHEHLVEVLKQRYIPEDYVVAAGKCLRDPQHIALFIGVVLSQYQIGRLNIPWWKAISEVLRFRANATKLVSSENCQELVTLAIELFEAEHRRRNGRELFRLVCLVIVYALRRRAFDDDFLHPDSDLAVRIKDEFRRARAHARSGSLRLMGGSIDLSQQLQLIIDYIDRKGKGQLLMGE